MKLVVGLGNPGKAYEHSRHNVGFMVLDRLAAAMNETDWKKNTKFNALVANRLPVALLAKPQTFMNESGVAVKQMVTFYKVYIPDVIVVHDDLDIKLGEYKIQQGHGPRLHNGVSSIEDKLHSEAFWRVRIGVDNRDADNRIPGEDYVLQAFSGEEKKKLAAVFEQVVQDLLIQLKK